MKNFKKNHGFLLDLGCGTCILKKYIPKDIKYIGIDLSQKMLRRCDDLNLIQADVEYLPFRDNSFNLIFLITVIQNLSDIQKILEEMKLISKKNCFFYISLLKKDELAVKFEESLIKSNFKLKEKIQKRELEDDLFIFIKK